MRGPVITLNLLALVSFALLGPGCVPVTEPVGDIDKAEPDKRLVGKWEPRNPDNFAIQIDIPIVKGHPKGPKRAVSHPRGVRV